MDGKLSWRYEEFVVEESRLVGDVWMPTKLKNLTGGSPLGENKISVMEMEVSKIEIGTVTPEDLLIPFPEGMEVIDVIQGISYVVGADQVENLVVIDAAITEGRRRQEERIGQPFELEFQDAIRGENITMADLQGQVVVIDFWATWCGPCVAEIPKLKALYNQYKDHGVAFIGVSLDRPEAEGGLEALKSFVAEHEIPWPQYYQGQGWNSPFSSSWGIHAIPTLFVVAPDGALHSTEARGKLEHLIPTLLKQTEHGNASDDSVPKSSHHDPP